MSQEEVISKIKEAIKNDPNKDVIGSVSLFGSYLHGDFTDKSDVDLLVDLKKSIGFFTFMAIQNRIEDEVGRPVQLMTEKDLSRFFREKVLKEAKQIY
jgi:predicted nucleotidyltransferase